MNLEEENEYYPDDMEEWKIVSEKYIDLYGESLIGISAPPIRKALAIKAAIPAIKLYRAKQVKK
jgi:hypothetical protein